MPRTVVESIRCAPNVPVPMTLNPVDAVEGMTVASERLKLIYIRNGGASPCEVTLVPGDVAVGAFLASSTPPLVFTVPAGGVRVIGEPESPKYKQSGGQLHLDFSTSDGVTVEAITI